jgi:hypothetical protein
MALDWIEILETAKEAKETNDAGDAVWTCVEPFFRPCGEQLQAYADEMAVDKSDSVLDPASIKELVLQTRQALRFCLWCLSSSDDVYDVTAMQSRAAMEYRWHVPLTELLTHSRGDKKCRVVAAKILCNLVTSNAETARIVSSSVKIAPSAESVSSSILESISDRHDDDDDLLPQPFVKILEPNWVDMLLSAAKSRNREAVGAIAAVLHNCISSLTDSKFASELASNGMLVSTLLRHFVSAESVTQALEKNNTNDKTIDHWDSATEWIQLLLSKLAKLGMLPIVFSSIDGSSTTTRTTNTQRRIILPEQNVLLQCMSREADVYVMEFGSNSTTTTDHPFGNDETSLQKTYLFFSEFIEDTSPWMRDQRHKTAKEESSSFRDDLLRNGFLTVNEIFASTLGVDSDATEALRSYLGEHTSVLQESAKSLGLVLDDLAEQSQGRKASDIRLSSDDQRLLVSLVQFLGNLCYKCPWNQNLLRSTLVPPIREPLPKVQVVDDAKTTPTVRNGLHVLLSCTTHATSCFTLREWGVIAIRNALEDNPKNQAIVEELMAQGPVESVDLAQAGVRVQLDSKGKVSLQTINE